MQIFTIHGVKRVRIRSYSGPHFPAFGLNTERYGVSLRIQAKWRKIRSAITPNTDTFYVVIICTESLLVYKNKYYLTLYSDNRP